MRSNHAHDPTTLSPPPRPLDNGQPPSRRLDVAPDPIVHAQRPGPLGLYPNEADLGPRTTAPPKMGVSLLKPGFRQCYIRAAHDAEKFADSPPLKDRPLAQRDV